MPARNTNIDAGREEITRLYLSGVGPKEIANSFKVETDIQLIQRIRCSVERVVIKND